MNKILYAAVTILRLRRLTAALDDTQSAAQKPVAVLTRAEIAPEYSAAERQEPDLGELNAEIAAALERSRAIEEQWMRMERMVAEKVRAAALRLKRAAAVAVFGLTAFSTAVPPHDPVDRIAIEQMVRTQKNYAMPEMDWGWLSDFPRPGEKQVIRWPEGELRLVRGTEENPTMYALARVQGRTRFAIDEAVRAMPPRLKVLAAQEPQLGKFVALLEELRQHEDPAGDQFAAVIGQLTEQLQAIEEEESEALEPLMNVFFPARQLVVSGLKQERGLQTPEGVRALEDFTRAMAVLGVTVEYVPDKG